MRRKDGKTKRKARRTMPLFEHGFRPYIMDNADDAPQTEKTHTVVSLFAGCGGFDLGMRGGFRFLDDTYPALPFEIALAVDNSEDAIETYKLNVGDDVLLADLAQLEMAALPSATILMGGFPCQDFSSSGTKAGFDGKRGQLYQVLTRYMRHHRPQIVLGENVPHLARLHGGRYLQTILDEFEGAGYRFDVWDLYAPDYGLPQSRRRLFLVGIRDDLLGFPCKPRPTHTHTPVSIGQALSDLEAITDESVTNQSQYFVATRATSGGGQGDHTNRADKVAYCIRANSRGRIQFHHHLPRRLTVRECARLQSFPDRFVFPFATQRNLTLIGNAVPPILAHHVGRAIADYLQTTTVAMERSQARQLTLINAV